MDNQENIQPVETTFHKRGNSVYMKIPPAWLKFLGVDDLKEEDKPDRKKGECYAQQSSKGEHYISGWNPDHPSQKTGEEK